MSYSTQNVLYICLVTTPSLIGPANNIDYDNYASSTGTTVSFSWASSSAYCKTNPKKKNIIYFFIYLFNKTTTTACQTSSVTYTLVVSGLGTYTTTTPSYTLTIANDGTYSWYVVASAGGVQSIASSTNTFTTCTYQPPSPVTLVAPLNGLNTTNSSIALSWLYDPTSFTWGKVCSLASSPGFVRQTIVQVFNGTLTSNYTFTANSSVAVTVNITAGQYSWLVFTANNLFSVSTTPWSFSVGVPCSPLPPSAPDLSSPAPSDIVQSVKNKKRKKIFFSLPFHIFFKNKNKNKNRQQ